MSPAVATSSTYSRLDRAEDQIAASNFGDAPESRPGSAGAIEVIDLGTRPSSQPNGSRVMASQDPTMTRRWYPHAAANRGQLKMSPPRAQQLGNDPAKDTGHTC